MFLAPCRPKGLHNCNHGVMSRQRVRGPWKQTFRVGNTYKCVPWIRLAETDFGAEKQPIYLGQTSENPDSKVLKVKCVPRGRRRKCRDNL